MPSSSAKRLQQALLDRMKPDARQLAAGAHAVGVRGLAEPKVTVRRWSNPMLMRLSSQHVACDDSRFPANRTVKIPHFGADPLRRSGAPVRVGHFGSCRRGQIFRAQTDGPRRGRRA
jgi:hypothetical protein